MLFLLKIYKIIFAVIFIAYPFIIYYGLLNFALWQIAAVVAVLAAVRLFILKDSQSQLAKIGFYASIVLIIFSLLSIFMKQLGWLKLYPILISLMSFVLFFSSLYSEKPMIQRFAELREKNIDAKKKQYMRRLTMIWCGFFLINATISGYTFFYSSLKQWTLYNGFISYVLMGCLFAGELLYRHLFVLKK